MKIDGCEHKVVLSNFNEVEGRFFDPRSKQSFLYDHVQGFPSDLRPWVHDEFSEPWRSALEIEWTNYCTEHYQDGACSVFSSSQTIDNTIQTISLNACLSGHQLQPRKFWNGRWRSIWTIILEPSKKDQKAKLTGLIKLHVHYYEDGNVQLVGSRDCKDEIIVTSPEKFASDVVAAVERLENAYQLASTLR